MAKSYGSLWWSLLRLVLEPSRHGRRLHQRQIVAAGLMTSTMLLSGCSISMPIGSLFGAGESDNQQTTASIPSIPVPRSSSLNHSASLHKGLDPEDHRRLQSALALALEPESPGLPVAWNNPATGAEGSFQPDGEFHLQDNQLCRAFKAEMRIAGLTESETGRACRTGPGNWAIIAKVE